MMSAIVTCLAVLQLGQLPLQTFDNYNQWKLALQNEGLTNASFSVPAGFQIEALRVASAEEGSWISLAFDPKGRLVVGKEKQGLYRFTFDAAGKVSQTELIDDTVQEARGLLFAHDSLYVTSNRTKAVYRLRDTDNDDRFDRVELLKTLDGGTGHGRNGLALGPDGKIYIACGNNVLIPKDRSPKSPYQRNDLGRLLPCYWNEFLFDGDVVPPCGWIGRFDPDGTNWEVVAGGFRNPYDLAFNDEGELFTYDADMEWDVGAPWYRPTTVAHVIPGGEYGWRQGTNVWPDHFPDALPRACDIGLGSPTGVAFGKNSKFPLELQKALFICDWAYGRIIAVHLQEKGSTYVGKPELFLQGKPMNVADIAFGPDGAMYFVVGGRGTRSAIYRVKYTWTITERLERPKERLEPPKETRESLMRIQRRKWETTGSDPIDSTTLSNAWTVTVNNSSGDDAHYRHAARRFHSLANENTDVWRKHFREQLETSPHFLLAEILRRESKITMSIVPWGNRIADELSARDNIALLRSLQLLILRKQEITPVEQAAILKPLEKNFPYTTFAENQLALELLVYLKSKIVPKTALSLLFKETSCPNKLFYLYTIRSHTQGWDKTRRLEQLIELKAAEKFPGAQYMPTFITYIRSDTLASLSDEHRTALKTVIDELGRAPIPSTATAASLPKVQDWTVADLTTAVEKITRPANLERGRELYAAAQCSRCHRFGDQGTMLGPDLTNVSSRFGRRELIESIVEPSKVIDGKYRGWQIVTSAGQAVTGQIVGGSAESLFIATDPFNLNQFQVVRRNEIESRKPSPKSIMPDGLANVLTAEDVYDLLRFIEQAK